MSPTHLLRLMFVICLPALAASCGEDDSGGSKFESGGTAGSGGSGGGQADVSIPGTGGSATGGSGGATSDASLGGSSGTGGSGGGGDCTAYGQGAECQACLDQNCCTEANACSGNTECAAMVDCARQCPEPANGNSQCVKDCNAGGPLYNGIMLCMGNSCGTVCPYL